MHFLDNDQLQRLIVTYTITSFAASEWKIFKTYGISKKIIDITKSFCEDSKMPGEMWGKCGVRCGPVIQGGGHRSAG